MYSNAHNHTLKNTLAQTNIRAQLHITHLDTYLYVLTNIRIYILLYTYIHIHACMQTCMHACIYTYIKCTHT